MQVQIDQRIKREMERLSALYQVGGICELGTYEIWSSFSLIYDYCTYSSIHNPPFLDDKDPDDFTWLLVLNDDKVRRIG